MPTGFNRPRCLSAAQLGQETTNIYLQNRWDGNRRRRAEGGQKIRSCDPVLEKLPAGKVTLPTADQRHMRPYWVAVP